MCGPGATHFDHGCLGHVDHTFNHVQLRGALKFGFEQREALVTRVHGEEPGAIHRVAPFNLFERAVPGVVFVSHSYLELRLQTIHNKSKYNTEHGLELS